MEFELCILLLGKVIWKRKSEEKDADEAEERERDVAGKGLMHVHVVPSLPYSLPSCEQASAC